MILNKVKCIDCHNQYFIILYNKIAVFYQYMYMHMYTLTINGLACGYINMYNITAHSIPVTQIN